MESGRTWSYLPLLETISSPSYLKDQPMFEFRQSQTPHNAIAWYRVPAVLFIPAPILAPFYHHDEPFITFLYTAIFFGCICSFTWLFKSKKFSSKIGTSILSLWYGFFTLMIMYKLY